MCHLVMLVEGADDRRFVEQIVFPRLHSWSQRIVKEYAQLSRPELEAIIRVYNISGWNYFILGDKDASPCISQRKSSLSERFGGVPQDKIIVVERTIEAWYLAGLSPDNHLRIEVPRDIDSCNKQKFEQVAQPIRKKSGDTILQIKNRLLEEYDWQLALNRSRSLRYFATKLGIGAGQREHP